MDEKMIRAENLEFRYTEEGKKALNGVSMQVKKGGVRRGARGERLRQIHPRQAF